ncbi:MAG TPA: hypothetical protein VM286_08290 [Candidatus Thermoplasmatota archaeon]|nr:hypothetical protein [Candidatus Thermoplasmatota archaeon]
MRWAVVAALLLLPGCIAHAPAQAVASALPDDPLAEPPRLLNCTVEHRFLGPEGFVRDRAPLQRATWGWGVNLVPVLDGLVPTRLLVPLVDPMPGGWSALAVGLQVRTHTGTFAVPPLSEAPIFLSDPTTYVSFPSPMPPGYTGGARSINLAFDSSDAQPLPGTLVFDSTFLTTGPGGLDLALTSDPGALDAYGHERVTRLDAFYCGGQRLGTADFLGYDFDSGQYDR